MKLIELINYLKTKYFPDVIFYLIGKNIFSDDDNDKTLSEL